MEWLLLLILVPAILLPVLLLCVFAGCTYIPPTAPPLTPTNLAVVNVSATTITLSWMNPDDVSFKFEVERLKEGDVDPHVIPVSPFPTSAVEIVDATVEPNTSYFYQVRSVRPADDARSLFSNSVFATTLQ